MSVSVREGGWDTPRDMRGRRTGTVAGEDGGLE